MVEIERKKRRKWWKEKERVGGEEVERRTGENEGGERNGIIEKVGIIIS